MQDQFYADQSLKNMISKRKSHADKKSKNMKKSHSSQIVKLSTKAQETLSQN